MTRSPSFTSSWKPRERSGASSLRKEVRRIAVAKFYRAEVIGSLLRPGYLKEARSQWTAGKLSTRAFKEVEDRAVDDAIALQERLASTSSPTAKCAAPT